MRERGVILLLCYINLLNYVDRGIIPGAPESFQNFMTETLGITVMEQNFYLGLLSSAFIASTAVFSLIFGYLAISFRPFSLISIGMLSWILAVAMCGVSYYVDNYWLLLSGRVLSGIGEASFHCNAMPFINRHAPKENSTLWLGIFVLSITVGMAAGYVYGSFFAKSSWTWAGAFFLEAILMLPPVVLCAFCIPNDLNEIPKDDSGAFCNLGYDLLPHELRSYSDDSLQGEGTERTTKPSDSSHKTPHQTFAKQWWDVFRNAPFSLIAFGHAAYTFSLASFSVFSPVILIGLGFFDNEAEVSVVFGAELVVFGTLGTIAGSMMLDKMTQGNSVSRAIRCEISVTFIFVLIIVTFICAMIMMLFTSSKVLFLLCLGITFFFMSAIGPAETVAVMELFPESRQAMAVAANTVVILLFGDVPSPVILGWLKDKWSPRCGTVETSGRPVLNPDCYLDRRGLDGVLLFAVLWLLWAVGMWGIAKYLLRRERFKQSIIIESPVLVD